MTLFLSMQIHTIDSKIYVNKEWVLHQHKICTTRNNGNTNSFASGVGLVNERVSINNSVLIEAGPTQTNGKVGMII